MTFLSISLKSLSSPCSHKVSQESDWRDVIQHIKEKYGRLDILVNNAGVTDLTLCNGKMQDPEQFDMEYWDKVHDINLKGVILGCKHAISLMKASPAASMLNQGAPEQARQ